MKRFDYRFLFTTNQSVIPDMVATQDVEGYDLVTIAVERLQFGLVFRKPVVESQDAQTLRKGTEGIVEITSAAERWVDATLALHSQHEHGKTTYDYLRHWLLIAFENGRLAEREDLRKPIACRECGMLGSADLCSMTCVAASQARRGVSSPSTTATAPRPVPADKACLRCGAYTNSGYCSSKCARGEGPGGH